MNSSISFSSSLGLEFNKGLGWLTYYFAFKFYKETYYWSRLRDRLENRGLDLNFINSDPTSALVFWSVFEPGWPALVFYKYLLMYFSTNIIYEHYMLNRNNMISAKESYTIMSTSQSHVLSDGTLLTDTTRLQVLYPVSHFHTLG